MCANSHYPILSFKVLPTTLALIDLNFIHVYGTCNDLVDGVTAAKFSMRLYLKIHSLIFFHLLCSFRLRRRLVSIVYVVRLINIDVWTFQTSIKFHIIRDLETSVALFKYIYFV